MPSRRTTEHLAVAHREALRRAVRAAQWISANAGLRGLLDPRHVLSPGVRLAHGLAEVVVDDGAPGRLRQACHQPVIELGHPAAARLNDAGAHVAQHVAERENLLLIGPQCRDMDTLWVVMSLVAGYRETKRATLDPVAHDVLHLLD